MGTGYTAVAQRLCVCRKGRAHVPITLIKQCNRKGGERKTRLRHPPSWLAMGFWLNMFSFLGVSQRSLESSLSYGCSIELGFLFV